MRKIHLILSLLLASFLPLIAQNFEWAIKAGGDWKDVGKAIDTDKYGNVYVCGYISGDAVFESDFIIGNGDQEVFIAKYNPDGELQWVKTAGGPSKDQGVAISVSDDGFVFIAGYFWDFIQFDDGNLVSSGNIDMFVAKYDTDGNYYWAKKAGGPYADRAFGISADNNGNVYVTGKFKGQVFFESTLLASNTSTDDIFLAKYSANGSLLWVKPAGGSREDIALGVATDKKGYVWITGFVYDRAFFGSEFVDATSTSSDIFVARYDSSGSLDWVKNFGGITGETAYAIATDGNANAYLTGYISDVVYFDKVRVVAKGYNDVFVTKLDEEGKVEWVRTGGGDQLDIGLSITADHYGNTCVTGIFDSLAVFNGVNLVGKSYDIFIAKFDFTGNQKWITTAGAHNEDFGTAIALGPNGEVYTTGYYYFTALFDSFLVERAEESDIFIAKLNDLTVGLENNPTNNKLNFNVNPNPTNNIVTFNVSTLKDDVVKVVIYDVNGKICLEQTTTTNNTISLSVNTLAPGSYLIHLKSADFNTIALSKLVVVK